MKVGVAALQIRGSLELGHSEPVRLHRATRSAPLTLTFYSEPLPIAHCSLAAIRFVPSAHPNPPNLPDSTTPTSPPVSIGTVPESHGEAAG